MIYQKPQLLYALFAIAIPIIIHLINLRKHKTIYFSSIRFLKEIKEENRKKIQLKNILILLSRIFAISFLVLAFAKPYLPANTAKTSNDIFLYIDNSKSMDIDFGDGNLLNIAKNKAIEITQAYSSEKNFYLITNDFESKHTASYNTEEIQLQIEKIKSSTKKRSINDIISRTSNINSSHNHLYFISDFQKNSLKISKFKEYNNNQKISLLQIQNKNISNISVDSLFTLKPTFQSDKEVEIHILISNTSKHNIEDEVIFLYLDGKQKSQQYINLLAQEKKEIIFNFSIPKTKKTVICGEIRINDSPISFDNNLFFTLTKSKKIKIIEINTKNKKTAFQTLFKNDSSLFTFNSLEIENINYNILSRQDLIILNEVEKISSGLANILISFINNGGSLLVTPPQNLNTFTNYNNLLRSLELNTIKQKRKDTIKINLFRTNHDIYKNVFTEKLEKINHPISTQTYVLNKNQVISQIIGFANKEDFLVTYLGENGAKYQFTSPLNQNYNNFANHALFVPTLINIAMSSILIKKPYYIIGTDKYIQTNNLNGATGVTHVKGENIDIIPTLSNKNSKQILNHHDQITKNGFYSIINNNQEKEKIAFNYNTSEGITLSLTPDELKQYISKNNISNTNIISNTNAKLKTLIQEQEIGKEYWKFALLLSLLFFAIEIILIKLITI